MNGVQGIEEKMEHHCPTGTDLDERKIKEHYVHLFNLRNVILEDLGKAICQEYDNDIQPVTALLSAEEKQANLWNIKNIDTHDNLRADLVEHLWNNHIIDGNAQKEAGLAMSTSERGA